MRITNAQLAKEITKLTSSQSLGEDICELLSGRDMRCADSPIANSIPNIVTIHFNVLGTFMEDRVLSNVKSGSTITEQLHRVRVRDAKVKKKGFKPFKFERETVCCFLVFQEIGEPPRNTNQPVRERHVNGQLAQSESHQAERDKSHCERSRIPWPEEPLR